MERTEMRISGIGNSQGGYYSHVRVDGMAKINGDTDCISFDSNGTLTVEGSLQSESVTMNGTAKIEGRASANRMMLDGLVTIKDQAVCHETLSANGRLSIAGGLIGEKVEIFGSLKSGGGVQCETFNVHGGFNIDGLLNAGMIDVKLSIPSKIKEIGGDAISVKRFKKVSVLEQFVPAFSARLQAQVIEGDEIDLEYTEADIVRGNVVRIGKGCKVGRVEYKDRLIREDDATIGTAHQM
ncbi:MULTISPECIES: hypothetical protein [Paenibacillus]|uniref:Polymer-forming cytoskeletal protein n=1 Tax=Paenibacillus albilobatus TaxID=2716884 RepID=A0A919XJG2_9BACL|nr:MULTISPECIES: hypothetical protein [Paenibacillus]GIO33331.1 hypothetical protein J2TS6_44720 [Paenibacillus albilobatus]